MSEYRTKMSTQSTQKKFDGCTKDKGKSFKIGRKLGEGGFGTVVNTRLQGVIHRQ